MLEIHGLDAYYGDAQDVKNRKLGCEELFGRLDEDLKAHA